MEWNSKLHTDFGAITIGPFLSSLITTNPKIAVLGFISLCLCGAFGSKIKVSKEGRKGNTQAILPSTDNDFIIFPDFFIIALVLNRSIFLSLSFGVVSFVCLCLVQFWSGPKVMEVK